MFCVSVLISSEEWQRFQQIAELVKHYKELWEGPIVHVTGEILDERQR